MAGVVAAGDKLTAQAGADILDRGGNAVDAAVGASFVSFIAEIGVVHLGGSGIAQIYDPAKQEGKVYDFFSNMPGLGYGVIDHTKLDFAKTTIDFGATTQDFYLGRGSVAVPGNIFGLCQMHQEYGQLSLQAVLQPALKLASAAIPLDQFQASTCKLLYPLYTHTESMRQIFEKDGKFIEADDPLFIPHLAETLKLIIEEGANSLRHGRLAKALVADQKTNGGLLTRRDLAEYEVTTHKPTRIKYRGYDILLPKPSSSGGVLTAFTLKLLGYFNLPRFRYGSSDHLQLLLEAMAATGRARLHWDMVRKHVPLEEATRRFLQDEFVADFATVIMNALMRGRPSRIMVERSGPNNTSHLSVIDGAGMTVGLTTTAGESAGYVLENTGFIPNNMLGEEDLHPAGFHEMPPGERIFTMMTPVVVLKDGQTKLVVGSGGSIRIRSAILQVISNVIDFGMPLQEGIDAPRVHLENRILQCELGINSASIDDLESLGYAVNRWDKRSMYFGGTHSVGRDDAGELTAAGDNRRNGAVAYSMVNNSR